MAIMVDCNRGWRMAGDVRPGPEPARARRLTEALGELGVRWVEEPLAGGDARGLAALRQGTGVAVAGGEMASSLDELLGYLDADALDVYQPDPLLTVGMLRTRMLGELAQARHRVFTPHTWTNGVGLVACLHLVAGVGGGPYVEFPYDPPGWSLDRRDFLLSEPVDIDADGFLAVPDRPGLGVAIDESRLSRSAR
jgi:L-alanine-DL-glutamate epimerase-like enolase superfamily enzyme